MEVEEASRSHEEDTIDGRRRDEDDTQALKTVAPTGRRCMEVVDANRSCEEDTTNRQCQDEDGSEALKAAAPIG